MLCTCTTDDPFAMKSISEVDRKSVMQLPVGHFFPFCVRICGEILGQVFPFCVRICGELLGHFFPFCVRICGELLGQVFPFCVRICGEILGHFFPFCVCICGEILGQFFPFCVRICGEALVISKVLVCGHFQSLFGNITEEVSTSLVQKNQRPPSVATYHMITVRGLAWWVSSASYQ